MKLDIPEQSAEQKAAETTRMVERLQNQARMREFDTNAPLKPTMPLAARIQHLLHMAVELDQRGLEAVINCAAFHRRYPKE